MQNNADLLFNVLVQVSYIPLIHFNFLNSGTWINQHLYRSLLQWYMLSCKISCYYVTSIFSLFSQTASTNGKHYVTPLSPYVCRYGVLSNVFTLKVWKEKKRFFRHVYSFHLLLSEPAGPWASKSLNTGLQPLLRYAFALIYLFGILFNLRFHSYLSVSFNIWWLKDQYISTPVNFRRKGNKKNCRTVSPSS